MEKEEIKDLLSDNNDAELRIDGLWLKNWF